MLLSTNIGFLRGIYSEDETISLLANAGFDAIDYSLGSDRTPFGLWTRENCREYADHLLAVAEKAGVRFNQAHAPLPISLATGQNTDDALKNVGYDNMEFVFHVCKLLKIPHIIIHGLSHPAVSISHEYRFQANLNYFRTLREIAEPMGVRLAIENLGRTFSRPETITAFLDALDDEYYMACVDIGHSNFVNGHADRMIRMLGSRVQALHVHDNHGDYDEHLIPGMGTADWPNILQALADVGYRGDFTTEFCNFGTSCIKPGQGYNTEFIPCLMKFGAQSARYLMNRLEHMK